MSHDNDFPENHDALRTRTHARPRPAKKPLAAQEGQRIPTRRAETPGRSSEPRAPRAQVPTDSRAPHVQASAEQRMPTSRKPIDSHARLTTKHPLPKQQRRGPQKPYSPLRARALRSHSSCSASCIGKALDPSTSW